MKAKLRITALLIALAPTAAAAQQRIDTPGTVAHAAAGTGFPERIGEFRRASVTRFDDAGRDISASYNLVRPEGRILITVYVYPASRSGPAPAGTAARIALCQREFDGVREVIAMQHKDASVVEGGEAAAPAGAEPQLSHRSVFRFRTAFDDGVQEVRSEARLYCFVGGDWLVKYRATSPTAVDAAAAIEAFIRAGPWPGRVPAEQTVARPAAASSAP